MRRLLFALGAVIACLTVYACAPRPDLASLHGEFRHHTRQPLIVIPGLMGSRLVSSETGEVVWDVDLWRMVTGKGLERLRLPVDSAEFRRNRDELVPRGFVRESIFQDFYGRLVQTLVEAGGYTCVPPSRVGPDVDCVLLAWDWRRDLVEAAARLDGVIESLRLAHDDPDLKVDVVAHSAGGLIARYYARFGSRDVLDQPTARVRPTLAGAAKMRKIVFIGTPNLGSITGLQQIMMGTQVGLVEVRAEEMATMPSVFQLLPHPDHAWMIDSHGNRIDRDLYDADTWRRYRVSIFAPGVRTRIRARFAASEAADAYLEKLELFFARAIRRGRRFQRALSLPLRDTSNEYIVLGSDCIMTVAVCLLETALEQPMIRLHPDQIVARIKGVDYEDLMLAPGDGVATRISLLARDGSGVNDPFPIDRVVFTCGVHAELSGDFILLHNLLNLLRF